MNSIKGVAVVDMILVFITLNSFILPLRYVCGVNNLIYSIGQVVL